MPKSQKSKKKCNSCCKKRFCPKCPSPAITLSPSTVSNATAPNSVIATGINLSAVTSVTIQIGAGPVLNVPFTPTSAFFGQFFNGCRSPKRSKCFPSGIPSQLTLSIPSLAPSVGTAIVTFNAPFCPPVQAMLTVTA
jgi:hypothetical protein